MAEEDKDPVVRMRALHQLVRRRDSAIGPCLQKLLKGRNVLLRPFAAWALGFVGGDGAVKALVEALRKNGKDPETLTCAVAALGRLGEPDPKVLKVLARLRKSLTGGRPVFIDPRTPTIRADSPDPPELRNRLLLEQTVIAAARLGDEQALTGLRGLLSGAWNDERKPVGHAKASGPELGKQISPLNQVCPTSILAVCEALAELGTEWDVRALRVITQSQTGVRLRVHLLQLKPLSDDVDLLEKQIEKKNAHPGVRSVALRLLALRDKKLAGKIAREIVVNYCRKKDVNQSNEEQQGTDVALLAALDVLFAFKTLQPELLVRVLDRAVDDWEYEPPTISATGIAPFMFSPPIVDRVIYMLGRSGAKVALPALTRIFGDVRNPGRAEAAYALGSIPGGLPVLVDLLDDSDGWVRYMAYLGLRTATGVDHFADWVYGKPGDRAAARKKYRALVSKPK
ncbi:HEAT repeat domain-containing protein [Planctomycetota bacterium]